MWQYVGNANSGGYKEGDLTYKYKGDPLSDGKLNEVGKDTEMPLPKYVEYFSFLFNQDDALDFSSAVSGIRKFTIGDICTYYFTLSHKWFIENDIKSFHMYDEYYYHYSDVRFTIKSNKTDGRILQISCSYDNDADAHWEFSLFILLMVVTFTPTPIILRRTATKQPYPFNLVIRKAIHRLKRTNSSYLAILLITEW